MSALAAWLLLVEAAQPAVDAAITPIAQEFQLIAAAHRDLRAYDLRIEITVSSANSSLPFGAVVKCDAQQRCLRIFRNSTTLQTPALSLMVDSNTQTITVTRHKLDDQRTANVDPAAAVQAWVAKGGELTGGELTADGRHWKFGSSMPGKPTGDMYVDPQSRRLQRLVYRSTTATGTRTVDVQYEWQDATRLDPAEFATSRFVLEKEGVIEPAQAFAQYRIIDADRH